MIGRHQKTLRAIFADPVRSNINWADIEGMLIDRGAVKSVCRFLEEGVLEP
jgi:hypothetical protein